MSNHGPSPGGHWREQSTPEGLVLESWGQGLLVGSLFVMVCLTLAAMRGRVLLHRLILAEQMLAIPHGTFCFMSFSGYGWYISWTATLLFTSYVLHNVVAWLKVEPFFVGTGPSYFSHRTGKAVRRVYLGTLAASIPVWVFNIYNNFQWNVNTSDLYPKARPYEFLARDPWWVFTNVVLLHIVSRSYGLSVFQLVRKSPRLAIVLISIVFALVFTVLDVVATILEGKLSPVDGINPWWKLSLIFKCLTDAIILDDFATELKRIAGEQSLPTAVSRLEIRKLQQQECTPRQPGPTTTGSSSGGAKRKDSPEYSGIQEIENVGGLSL